MDIIIKETPHYHKPLIPSYQGNPLIEALDPIAETQEEALGRLIIKPEFNPVELNMPVYARCHFPVRLRHFLFPTDKQAEIYYGTVLQVFEGYGHRNPLMAEGQRYVHRFKGRKEWVRIKRQRPGTISFITGLSGMGKTRSIESVLAALGATVVIHTNYKGSVFTESQIVVLKSNVGDQISTKAFAQRYGAVTDRTLGVDIYAKNFGYRALTRSDFIRQLSLIISNHFVGVLVIDEFQNLKLGSKNSKAELIAMLIDIRDELGIPIILVGTYKAVDILRKDASISRRLVEGGYHEIQRPLTAQDPDFIKFCRTMWPYQWVRKPKPISEEIIEALYDCSMGVTGILINVFIYAQHEAMINESETVDAATIKKVYKEHFKPFHNIIIALRHNTPEFLKQYDDLYLEAFAELEVKAPASLKGATSAPAAKPAHDEMYEALTGKDPEQANTNEVDYA